MKSKCTKCQEMRKASGLSYLKCPKCKQEARDERKKNKKKKTKKIVYKSEMAKTNDELRKISKRLNQDSINKFIKERYGRYEENSYLGRFSIKRSSFRRGKR